MMSSKNNWLKFSWLSVKNTLIFLLDLEEEAAKLKRLLNKDVQLDPIEGVPLLTASVNINRNLQHLREELKKRYEQIDEYLIDQESFCEILGEPPKELKKDPLPTEAELNEFKTHLDNLAQEKTIRLDKISKMRREINIMRGHLEEFTFSDREDFLVNAKNFPPTRANMRALTDLYENTVERYEDLKTSMDKVCEKLKGLWDYLQASPSVVKKFSKYTEYNQTNYDKLYNELDRCETIRRDNIENFIRKVREEILIWWDKCLKSREERARFSTYNTNVYNEDALDLHELELNDLKDFYERNENIFKLIQQRQEMWEKMKQLEEKANDPNRFKNRGGKLLEEERERKQIGIKLPKIEAELMDLCAVYEEENKRKFTIFGRFVSDVIKDDYQRRDDEKAMISSARKKANLTTSGKKVNTTRTPKVELSVLRPGSVQKSGPSQSILKSSSKKPVLSTSKSVSSLKRKASPAKSAVHAKRSLLHELNMKTPEPLASSTFRKPAAPKTQMSASKVMPQLKPMKRIASRIYDDHTAVKRVSIILTKVWSVLLGSFINKSQI